MKVETDQGGCPLLLRSHDPGGPERRDPVRPGDAFGTAEADFGESKGPLLTFGWEGVLLWSTLGREELIFIVHIL